MVAIVLPTVVWAFVLAALICLDASYCGMETGLYRLNKIRLDLQADQGRPSAIALQRLVSRFDRVLATLLIGTNLARYSITFIVSMLLLNAGVADDVELITMAIVTPALFVLDDSVPKNVFQRHAERLVHHFVWLLRGSTWLFHACGLAYLVRGFSVGVLRLLGGTKREAYALGHRAVESIVAEGRASGLLTDYQSAMADRVMRLAELTLGDITIPLAQAMTAPESISREDLSAQVAQRSYSRLPLLDADGQVTGVLDVFDFLTAGKDRRPGELAQPPLLLPDGASLTASLVAIQRSGQALAVATGAGVRHVGVVSAKDITEQIVGELNTSAD